MNEKEIVIANMRTYVKNKANAAPNTLVIWANLLEQSEQQTTPSPEGQGCSGESSVQPAAIAELESIRSLTWKTLKAIDNSTSINAADFGKIRMLSIDLHDKVCKAVAREIATSNTD